MSLPDYVLQFIQSRFPNFRLKRSRTAGLEYYGNVCPNCDALTGDHYLHRPGDAFFPMSDEEAARLNISEVPLSCPAEFEASSSIGLGEMILQHARRIVGGAA